MLNYITLVRSARSASKKLNEVRILTNLDWLGHKRPYRQAITQVITERTLRVTPSL